MRVLELFGAVDDFCQQFEPAWHQYCLTHGLKQRNRARQLALSEIMTILIVFHQSHYRTFKAFYTKHVCVHLCRAFPTLVSYNRCVEFFPSVLLPLGAYLSPCLGTWSGISCIDSTALAICHNRRIQQHRVFRGLAARGKTSDGWFFGFTLHLLFNDRGELLNFTLTPGNIDDRTPVPAFAQHLFGKLFGDKGYLSQVLAWETLQRFGVELITSRRSNMKQVVRSVADTMLLRKRAIVETIIDQLKHISHIEHTRHRSPINFLVNVVCGLIAYCHQRKKPSLQRNVCLS